MSSECSIQFGCQDRWIKDGVCVHYNSETDDCEYSDFDEFAEEDYEEVDRG